MVNEATPLLCDTTDADAPQISTTQTSAPSHGHPHEHAVEEGTAGDDDEVLKPKASIAAVMVPMMLGIFLVAMDQTVVASTYASIGSQFNALQNTSWIATGYMLTLTSFQPLYGKLSDIFGRKSCLIFAYCVFALGCLLCGLARNMTQLIAARAIAGIGGGGMSTVASIIMSDVVPLRKRGTWQGVANIAYAAGSATGAPLGGVLADTIGWRWAFLLQVPLTVLAILSVSLGLKLPKVDGADFRVKLQRVDFGGAITLVVAVFSLLLALDRGGNVSWGDKVTLTSLGTAFVCWIAFAMIEARIAAEPFAPRHIITDGSLLASYVVNFLLNGTFMVVTYHIPLFLQAVRGLSAAQVGLALIPCIVGGVSASISSGLIMQATGRYYALTLLASALMLLASVFVALLTGPLPFSIVALCSALFGMNFGGGGAITTTLVALIANAGPQDQAVATAVSYLFRSLGAVLCLSISTTVAQDVLRTRLHERISGADVDEIILRVRESLAYIGELPPAIRAAVVRSYEDSIQAALWFAACLAALTVVCSVFIKEKPLSR